MGAAGGDESSQDNRGEHDVLFLLSVVFWICVTCQRDDRKAQRLYPVLPGGSYVYRWDGKGEMPDVPCQENETKRDLIRDELCSAMVMRGSTK